MAINQCINPYLAADLYEWDSWTGVITRQAVTGFARGYAARRVTGTAYETVLSAPGVVVVGQAVTVSLSVRSTALVESWNASIDIQWCDDALAQVAVTDYASLASSLTANTVKRYSRSAVAPAGATQARVLFQWTPPAAHTVDFTQVRITPDTADQNTYYDGSSTGWRWVGAVGTSASEAIPAAVVDGYIWSGSAWVQAQPHKVFIGTAWA